MHPNYDPRDDTQVRPQVGFRLKPGSSNVHEFLTSLRERLQSYHDMGLLTQLTERSQESFVSHGTRHVA